MITGIQERRSATQRELQSPSLESTPFAIPGLKQGTNFHLKQLTELVQEELFALDEILH